MKIEKIINKVMNENTYFLSNDTNLIVVDPGSDTKKIMDKIEEINLPLTAILLTHAHYDHIISIPAIKDKYPDVPVYVATPEVTWLYTPEYNQSHQFGHQDGLEDVIVDPADYEYEMYSDYDMDGFKFKVVPTPGHSIGGVSFIFDDDELVLTGDALFKGTVGITNLYTGDYDQLLNGIRTELFTLPKNYEVYPGHGPKTDIGTEKMYNPHFNR
ncbi:MBL fold metallo-hydrolase [Floricoccus penangensis]|uniref:MBL fold metallo-hydrolase n=1 Tax=Floricoccus penangensis TaxID=1859475 RepID=UPI00203EDEB8|nr:MBL fold metallo-hydrolase [Floricoccus penangensis]URZ87861.1 MBL fold metallo-hydrolase [Floricoccus penangensis]